MVTNRRGKMVFPGTPAAAKHEASKAIPEVLRVAFRYGVGLALLLAGPFVVGERTAAMQAFNAGTTADFICPRFWFSLSSASHRLSPSSHCRASSSAGLVNFG